MVADMPHAIRSRALAVLGGITLLIAACGGTTAITPSPTPGGGLPGASSGTGSASGDPGTSGPLPSGAVDPTPGATPSAGGTRLVVLHGTFTGHGEQPLSTADQTVEVELDWYAGPDDIHDSRAFRFVSGSFTFSESIDGVCGGSRSEAGPLTAFSDTFLVSGDMQDPDRATASLTDQRLSSGAVELSLTSSFAVSAPDPEGCADLSRTGVPTCTLKFLQTAIGELRPDATCADASRGVEWAGRLAP
jgi:hypothetical protein